MVENLKKGYDDFLIKEISKYINQELKSGKPLQSIKKALLEAGHDRNAIEIAVLELEKHNFSSSFNAKSVENDAEKKIIHALEVFIEDRIKHGVGIEKIKKVLKDYGHSDRIIEQALINVRYKPKKMDKTRHFPRSSVLEKEHILLTGIISVILLVTMSAAVIDESIFLVFIGFIPTTVTILIGYYYIDSMREKIFIVPFVVCALFFVAGMISPQIGNMEYGSLAILNLILSFVIVLLFNQVELPEPVIKEERIHPEKIEKIPEKKESKEAKASKDPETKEKKPKKKSA